MKLRGSYILSNCGFCLSLQEVLVLVIGFGIGASIGLAERVVGGEVADAQTAITENLGIPGVVVIIAIFSVLLFAHLNVAAKRIRDMGLPG